MNILLFAAGLLYLAFRGPVTAAFLAFGLLTSYVGARFVRGRKWVLILTLTVNAAALLAIRLLPYTALPPLAPFGISYYTFQILSYLTDVYRGKYEPEKNFFWYAYYLTFLPHLFPDRSSAMTICAAR